jgi:hypothetical protein
LVFIHPTDGVGNRGGHVEYKGKRRWLALLGALFVALLLECDWS